MLNNKDRANRAYKQAVKRTRESGVKKQTEDLDLDILLKEITIELDLVALLERGKPK